MKRKEFIDTLRTLLQEELPDSKIEENISYYDNYIREQGNEEKQEEEIERIGPPHLIAQTIIESYKMSGERRFQSYSNQDSFGDEQPEKEENSYRKSRGTIMERVKKVCIGAVVIIFLLALLRFAFVLFVRIGLPLIVAYLVIRLIRKNR
ncbi:HAAS signaling domain-containing protein [[Clostridium] polysaccharolyticum]|uniref:DUF1700 domain-containing protein n=1 Tax=[Clostridium] polysaccharolyticum TaxID=29364 RepID=A0A1I0FSC0_9FIRM|nr:hypothetical protein [[Clostridium] polysaccharolyticum]SET61279.1 hypothetical protein SAMN04487772_13710 [[Clostridium] polysaccharolyticum]